MKNNGNIKGKELLLSPFFLNKTCSEVENEKYTAS
jgi:hypothetical protein